MPFHFNLAPEYRASTWSRDADPRWRPRRMDWRAPLQVSVVPRMRDRVLKIALRAASVIAAIGWLVGLAVMVRVP